MAEILLDAQSEIAVLSPVCTFCKHLDFPQVRHCTAFPNGDGIPLEIWNGENDHTHSFPGDNGVRFEEAED